MYRKSRKDNIVPMPKQQLFRIEKAFKRTGGVILRNEETDAYLAKRNAEGITIDAKTILLKQKPGRASVFEELIHSAQYRMGKNDGSPISRLKCEIEAQEKLLTYSKQYCLTEIEIAQTKDALACYKKELLAYIKK